MKLRYLKIWENFDYDSQDKMLRGYLGTALWSERDVLIDNHNLDLEKDFDLDDFTKEAIDKAKKDCELFKEKAGDLLNGLDLSIVGHDFWLTRNGHGAGFWDGDYEKSVGEKLTQISKEFGVINLFLTEDDKILME